MTKIFVISLLFSVQLVAAIIKVQSPGCISQSSLNEFSNAVQSGDQAGMIRLVLNQECFVIKPGTSYGLINKQSSKSLIRVYWDSNGYKLWVPTKAIQ